jgi:hypothetical protein
VNLLCTLLVPRYAPTSSCHLHIGINKSTPNLIPPIPNQSDLILRRCLRVVLINPLNPPLSLPQLNRVDTDPCLAFSSNSSTLGTSLVAPPVILQAPRQPWSTGRLSLNMPRAPMEPALLLPSLGRLGPSWHLCSWFASSFCFFMTWRSAGLRAKVLFSLIYLI